MCPCTAVNAQVCGITNPCEQQGLQLTPIPTSPFAGPAFGTVALSLLSCLDRGEATRALPRGASTPAGFQPLEHGSNSLCWVLPWGKVVSTGQHRCPGSAAGFGGLLGAVPHPRHPESHSPVSPSAECLRCCAFGVKRPHRDRDEPRGLARVELQGSGAAGGGLGGEGAAEQSCGVGAVGSVRAPAPAERGEKRERRERWKRREQQE